MPLTSLNSDESSPSAGSVAPETAPGESMILAMDRRLRSPLSQLIDPYRMVSSPFSPTHTENAVLLGIHRPKVQCLTRL